eukprot:13312872-Alexandrium_andersonii.AAC.1
MCHSSLPMLVPADRVLIRSDRGRQIPDVCTYDARVPVQLETCVIIALPRGSPPPARRVVLVGCLLGYL